MTTEKEVIAVLKDIVDPHTNVSVYDMGLVSEIKVSKDTVSLTFRPTSPFCPLGPQLAENIRRRVQDLKGVKKASVKVVGHIWEDQINKSMRDA